MDVSEIRKAIVRIKVIGVGGGGNSVLLRLANDKIPGIELIAVNTDAKQLSLLTNAGISTLQIGERLTKGRGTGGVPSTGEQAAEGDISRLESAVRGADLVFITAGMGGGVGTGAAPVVARLAREARVLSIGVVTTPFSFEGKRKSRVADEGIAKMQSLMDAVVVVKNDNLMKFPENKRMTFVEAFRAADGILRQAILCVSEVILTTGVVNVDFADVTSIFRQGRSPDAILGIGESKMGRVVEAVQAAIESPLIDRSLEGARGIILNISGNEKLPLYEVNEAMEFIAEHAHPDVNIIFGTVVDDSLGDDVRATLVATDFVDGVIKTAQNPHNVPRRVVNQPTQARKPAPHRPVSPSGATATKPAALQETSTARQGGLAVPNFMTPSGKGGAIPPFNPS